MRRLATVTTLCCFILAVTLLQSRGDETGVDSSKIKATWKLAPDFHNATLALANNGGKPVYISSRLDYFDTHFKPKSKIPDDTPVAITNVTELHPLLIFINNPNYPPPQFYGENGGGTMPMPYPVDPGKTVELSYKLNGFPDPAKYIKIELLLLSGDKVFSKLVLKSDGKTWAPAPEKPASQ